VQTLARTSALAALLMLAAALGACDAPAQTERVGPIRVVRVGRPDIAAMKEVISGMWALCKSGKEHRIVNGPAPLPSDAYLAEFRAEESEDLFDGKQKASYHTSRTISPDIRRNCELTVFTERVASIEHACRHYIGGSTTPIIDFFDNDTPATHEVNEEELECLNDRPAPPDDVAGLPSESAGNARCIWQSKMLFPESAVSRSSSSEEKDRGVDICLYERLPTYPFGDGRYPVILKIRQLDRLAVNGPRIPKFLMAHLVLKDDPIAFSDGDPIPPQRFTRAALESFLKQPTRTPIESAR